IGEELRKRVLKDCQLLRKVRCLAPLRKSEDFIGQVRPAIKVVVARDHGELTACHDTKRFEQSPYRPKIACITIAREIASDDDMVRPVTTDGIFKYPSQPR